MKIIKLFLLWLFVASSSNIFSTTQAQTPFQSTTLKTGANPYCVIQADVNGDGKLDLISANSGNGSGHTLTVLTNSGNGIFGVNSIFGSNATYTVGSNPESVVAADVNNDGKIDLISANFGSGIGNTLTVLTNNGSGIFGSNATYTVGEGPQSVIAADINGDGKIDLVTANYNNASLTVLTNNGSGIFGSNATYTANFEPVSVVAADINNDGKLDLITANLANATMTVLTNSGNGVFGSNATYTLPSSPFPGLECVVAADVNCDGKVDLIVADGVASTLTVLTNNGKGVFGSNATYKVGDEPKSVIAADVNGDGKVDLISASQGDATLMVLTNNGYGIFGSNATYVVGGEPISVVAADVNNDGKVDLICANYLDGTLTALIASPVGVPPPLGIASAGNQVVVYSPPSGANFILQTTTNLSPPNWVAVTNGAAIVGVLVTNSIPGAFFRLQ